MSQAAKNVTESETIAINGEGLAFPGVTGKIDTPFEVRDGIPLAGALEEASALLNGAWETVRRIARKTDNAELAGSAFLIQAADSLICSMARGFEAHPLAKKSDGYHA